MVQDGGQAVIGNVSSGIAATPPQAALDAAPAQVGQAMEVSPGLAPSQPTLEGRGDP